MVKKGFSLAEAVIVMGILSIFFGIATKVVTTRPKPKVPNITHGYFECWNRGAQQRYVRNKIESATTPGCHFVPPSGIMFFNINIYDKPTGTYYSSFQTNIVNKLHITFDADQVTIRNEENNVPFVIPKPTNGDTYIGEDVQTFYNIMYPDSKINHGGHTLNGIMISW